MVTKIKDWFNNNEFFNKVKEWLKAHESMMQIVKFILISLIAFVTEFAVMYALQYGLKNVCGQEDFSWWIFYYDAESSFGLAGFIAIVVSKAIAEVISFIINRKKNFEADNNIVFSAVVYVITVVGLFIFTTWLTGIISNAMGVGEGMGVTIGKMIGSVISFVVIFIMDKFVIMTKKKVNKNDDAVVETATEEALETENVEE